MTTQHQDSLKLHTSAWESKCKLHDGIKSKPQPIVGYELHPKIRKAFLYIFGICCFVILIHNWLGLPRFVLNLFGDIAIVVMCFFASIKLKLWAPVSFSEGEANLDSSIESNLRIKVPFPQNDVTGCKGETIKNNELKAEDLKPVFIFDNTLTESQKDSVQFELYLNGNKGSKYATYWDFCEFLDMYGIDRSSTDAALVEAGVPIETPDGKAKFIRVSPSDEIVLAATKNSQFA